MVYLELYWSEELRVAPAIVLTQEQEAELTGLVRSKLTSVRLAQRAQIVLLAAQGMQNKEIADQLGIGRVQVARWRKRYLASGLAGIEHDLPRGAPPVKVDGGCAEFCVNGPLAGNCQIVRSHNERKET